jgi:hypothetical protein
VSVESHGGDDASWGKLLTDPPELSGSPTSRVIWEQVGRMDEGVKILHIQYLRYLSQYLTCCKILRHGASGFTSHPKEGVLQIVIALQNPSPRPGLNLQPLGSVASTLTTTPLRWHSSRVNRKDTEYRDKSQQNA